MQEVGSRGTLYYAEICAGYFHWTPQQPIVRQEGGFPGPSSPYFSPAQIGPQKYRAVRVTISRTCRRLAERGLVEWSSGMVKRRRQRAAIG
jgi:hypothetical protein